MKRKNGFTLIEVLTVIVILAIIALIAVPVIMSLVGKANKSAFKDSAYALIKAGDLLYSTSEMEGAELSRKTFDFSDDNVKLDVKGELPTGGIMKVYENGQIAMAVTKGKYCAIKKYGSEEVSVTEDTENCELPKLELGDIIYFDPTLGEKGMLCTEGDYLEKNSESGHKDGCMRWYVYNSDGTESKLILDHDTTDKFAPNAESMSLELIENQLNNDTKSWKTKANLIEIDEALELIPWYKNEEYTDKDNWYDEYLEKVDSVYDKVIAKYVSIEDIKIALDNVYNDLFENYNNILLPKFFHSSFSDICVGLNLEDCVNNKGFGFWTKTVSTSDNTIWAITDLEPWGVEKVSITSSGVATSVLGIRPIITITQ